MSSCTNASLKFQDSDQSSLLTSFKVMLSGGVEEWNPNAVGYLREGMNQFRC